jgi:hypothetical protein
MPILAEAVAIAETPSRFSMLADRSLANWSLRLTLANQPDRARNVRIGSPGCLVAQ